MVVTVRNKFIVDPLYFGEEGLCGKRATDSPMRRLDLSLWGINSVCSCTVLIQFVVVQYYSWAVVSGSYDGQGRV
jgi:hypothetical protein